MILVSALLRYSVASPENKTGVQCSWWIRSAAATTDEAPGIEEDDDVGA